MLAHAFGLEAEFLRAAGYDVGQGYHFNRAIPAADCFVWMQKFTALAQAAPPVPEPAASRQTAA